MRAGPLADAISRAAARGLDPGQAWIAWEMSRLPRGASTEETRAIFDLSLDLLAAMADGSTCLPAAAVPGAGAMGSLHPAVVGRPGDHVPIVLDGGLVYAQRMLALETSVAARLRRMAAAGGTAARAAAGAAARIAGRPSVHDDRPVNLSGDQVSAIECALSHGLTVITGGPGTGKTFLIASILRALVESGEADPGSIALAAPTGKAADRLRRSVAQALSGIPDPTGAEAELLAAVPEARTVHRLLGYSPSGDRFRHGEENPLSERVVVVDEASMLDLAMTDRLLGSVGPRTRLILVGDADQLPPVDAGAVLRDVVAAGGDHVVRLTESYRMDPSHPEGRQILEAALSLNSGDGPALVGRPGGREGAVRIVPGTGDLTLSGMELIRTGDGCRVEEVIAWWDEAIGGTRERLSLAERPFDAGPAGFDPGGEGRLAALFEASDRARILCLTRGDAGGTGEAAVNAILHDRIARGTPGGAGRADGTRGMLPGEPVVMLRNDYEKGLWNGDQGMIVDVARAGRGRRPVRSAVFQSAGSHVSWPVEALGDRIQLSHAITVHRAQGSEHDRIAVVLPHEDMRLVSREVLYTAITRARKSVLIVGDDELVEIAAGRRLERHSGLAGRLGGRIGS